MNDSWESSGRLYRVLVFAAMGFIAVGLILTIAGTSTENRPLTFTGLPFIGVGLLLHIAGLVARGRAARRRLGSK
ncbi:DUF3188 domain-containing protein [Paenarthrobacter sp. Z7-10]|uniref:DUF3188 domain-containing protein n=1 Tax=Paenarthrobacter sp. Z7-10 TaxID=2787635 RepID=UPI0022A8E44D|nr:DUF3188 domain-containing protein [Paenarthrobacter sp. Z7-10]MCZ2402139.1 DUF3188 domain-containing protein [Paenarthrobacter sp. Z7-10]